MVKTISLSNKAQSGLFIKSKIVDEMDIDDLRSLVNWCDFQDENLWEGLTPQEILNVYRVSAEYVDFQSWVEFDREAAIKAWNRAVINPENEIDL